MKSSRSEFASKRYPNLYKYPGSASWMFRKYCKEKRREFKKTTGIENDEAKAYKIGVGMFNEWLGVHLPSGREMLVKDIARAVLSGKELKADNTFRSSQNQLENHVVPAFGHLKPSQITPLRWNHYEIEERRKGKRTKLFNTRKALLEILNRAKEEGLIRQIPKLKLLDGPPKPPKYLEKQVVRQILRHSFPQTKILFYIMWKQGARPGEILQYEWAMLDWTQGDHGYIHIPGRITKTRRPRSIPLNSRVSRILKRLILEMESKFIFPSRYIPNARQTNYLKGWKAVCDELKIDADPTNLRDTFITDCLKRGLSSTFIAKYVDNSVVMIEKKYAVAEHKVMQGVAG